MTETSTNRAWAEHEFGEVSLGDARLDRRLLDVASEIADRPTASHPQRLDWNELRGFYRLVHSPRAQPHLLQQTHRQRTVQRMLACPNRVLNIHDTTEFDFSSHTALHPHLGPIGNGIGHGLLQHNSIAFDPVGKQILGLAHQQMIRRRPAPENETRTQRRYRADKESRLWLDGFRALGRPPQNVCWIDVCDRGADYYEAMQESLQLGHDFLIRIHEDRCCRIANDPKAEPAPKLEAPEPEFPEPEFPEPSEPEHVKEVMRAMQATTRKTVEIASRGGRPARTVELQVGWQTVWLSPPKPDGLRRGLRPLRVTLIRAWEAGRDEAADRARQAKQEAKAVLEVCRQAKSAAEQAGRDAEFAERLAKEATAKKTKTQAQAQATAAREQAQAAQAVLEAALAQASQAKQQAEQAQGEAEKYLDWWLASSRPTETEEAALEAISDYQWRWPIAEEYHKAQKSGLQAEEQRFESWAPMVAALAILAVMAIRLLQLRYAREEQPEADASMVATEEEIEMTAKATKRKETKERMTVKEFVDRVAQLGGYLGRKNDGPPGWMSLWRGYQRLTDLLLGAELVRPPKSKPTSGRRSDQRSPPSNRPD